MSTTPVNNNNGSANGGSSGNPVAANSSGDIQNMFTTLLVAQIKNQDPLAPTDPSAFVNQLTQLSQMQAMQRLADQGDNSGGTLQSLQMLALGGQVGSDVQARVDTLNLADQPVTTHFTLQSKAAAATLVLTGEDGTVQKFALGAAAAGDNSYTLDPAKLGLHPGNYAVHVETDTTEQAGIEIAATLSSVKVGSNGGAVLTLGDFAQVDPSAITQFNGRPSATNPVH